MNKIGYALLTGSLIMSLLGYISWTNGFISFLPAFLFISFGRKS
tara:strand:+ start:29 stop:160 length:132 start_codon:yes stop_codon:yes gene_type:complete